MANLKNIKILALALLILTGCGQSLEDTIEGAGDGRIRYIGKCSNINISSGWELLRVEWDNGMDSDIAGIKVQWSANNKTNSVMLEAGTTTYDIPTPEDGSYEVVVWSVDTDGNLSLPGTVYGRPFTPNHESVRAFSTGLTNYYMPGNNLMLYFEAWNEDIESIVLKYTDTGGSPQEYVFKHDKFDSAPKDENGIPTGTVKAEDPQLIKNVDVNREMTLYRKGRIKNCVTEVEFEPIELVRQRVFSSGFRNLFLQRFGTEDPTQSQLDGITELYIDYNVYSMTNILNLPNLKKLILGKNRYLYPSYLSSTGAASVLTDVNNSLYALAAAFTVTAGFVVEQYNDHFLDTSEEEWEGWVYDGGDVWEFNDNLPDWADMPVTITKMGNPLITDAEGAGNGQLTLLDANQASGDDSIIWTIADSQLPDPTAAETEAMLQLLDNKPSTTWEPKAASTLRVHQLTIDMKASRRVNGVKIVQKTFVPGDAVYTLLTPTQVQIEVSTDNINWGYATYARENILGETTGEVTYVMFNETKNVRYIRVTVNDSKQGNNYYFSVADIIPFSVNP